MSDYVKGLVSVVIPTYKRSDMLMTAIDSVLNQTYRNIELIVVNDNIIGDEYSRNLYKLIETIDDKRFLFLEQEKHINGAAARNVGIRAAKGEYIAFQDDDDYWEKDKIENQVKLLSTLDNTWGAVSCLKKIYKNGHLIEATRPYKSGYILQEILDGRISLGTGAVLIRREALDDSGYFDEKLIRHQDLQLFARLASKYKIMLDKKYYQNRETKDAQNRLNSERLIEVKKAYFESINDILETIPLTKRAAIIKMHSFDVAYLQLKEKKYKECIRRCTDILLSPYSVYVAIVRFYNRKYEHIMKRNLVRKYGGET